MEYISSDTNVWIDFHSIKELGLPFRLNFTYIMNIDAIHNELIEPEGLSDSLVSLGLKPVELEIQELLMADEWGVIYKRLSRYDRIALAIAKNRRIVLLTGDRALRNAAKSEDVSVIGTLGIMDMLLKEKKITKGEYKACIKAFKKLNNGEVRLPSRELEYRLNNDWVEKNIINSKGA
jgi:predicted nucleic acid-binding protein